MIANRIGTPTAWKLAWSLPPPPPPRFALWTTVRPDASKYGFAHSVMPFAVDELVTLRRPFLMRPIMSKFIIRTVSLMG